MPAETNPKFPTVRRQVSTLGGVVWERWECTECHDGWLEVKLTGIGGKPVDEGAAQELREWLRKHKRCGEKKE